MYFVLERAPMFEIENARAQVHTLVNNLRAICLNRWSGWLCSAKEAQADAP